MTYLVWVAVKELSSSYYIGEAILITICIPIMVTYVEFLNSNPDHLLNLLRLAPLTTSVGTQLF